MEQYTSSSFVIFQASILPMPDFYNRHICNLIYVVQVKEKIKYKLSIIVSPSFHQNEERCCGGIFVFQFPIFGFQWHSNIFTNSFPLTYQFHSYHCVKSVCIRSFSASHFPPFILNSEIYSVSLRIQSECGKINTRKAPNTDTFRVVCKYEFASLNHALRNTFRILNFLKHTFRCEQRRSSELKKNSSHIMKVKKKYFEFI